MAGQGFIFGRFSAPSNNFGIPFTRFYIYISLILKVISWKSWKSFISDQFSNFFLKIYQPFFLLLYSIHNKLFIALLQFEECRVFSYEHDYFLLLLFFSMEPLKQECQTFFRMTATFSHSDNYYLCYYVYSDRYELAISFHLLVIHSN